LKIGYLLISENFCDSQGEVFGFRNFFGGVTKVFDKEKIEAEKRRTVCVF